MQAIQIKRANPTDSKGTRWNVKSAAGRAIVGYRHELGLEDNVRNALSVYLIKMGWCNTSPLEDWSVGQLADGSWAATYSEELGAMREAVNLTREAMRDGELAGNPYCKPFGQAVCRALGEKL